MGVLVLSKRWDTWKLLESTRALSRPSLFPSFSLFLFFFLISFRGHSMKPSPLIVYTLVHLLFEYNF